MEKLNAASFPFAVGPPNEIAVLQSLVAALVLGLTLMKKEIRCGRVGSFNLKVGPLNHLLFDTDPDSEVGWRRRDVLVSIAPVVKSVE